MIRVRAIDSVDLPELEPYRTMRWQEQHRKAGLFVAEGAKVVLRLLESPLQVISVLLPEPWLDRVAPLVEGREEVVELFVAPKPALEALTGFSLYQGLLGLARVPQARPLEDLLATAPRPKLLMAVEGVSNAENMGVLVRNCAAFGAHALVSGETCASPFLRRAVRSSMGNLFTLPVCETASLAGALAVMRAAGLRVIGAHPAPGSSPVASADFRGDCCVLMGSEGDGISPSALAECDERVEIPMRSGVDSLNVGSAAAVVLYEAARQRATP